MMAPPETPSASAVCAWHPRVRASTTCERCGSFACLDCFDIVHARELCRSCAQTTAIPGATRPRRLVARAIDHALGSMVIVAALDSVPGTLTDSVRVRALVSLTLALSVLFLVQGLLLVWRGQTVGKWVVGIAIRRPDGSRATGRRLLFSRELPVFLVLNLPLIIVLSSVFAGVQASFAGSVLMRTFFGLSSVPGTVDALSIFRAEERCIHDLIADTVVVRARGRAPELAEPQPRP